MKRVGVDPTLVLPLYGAIDRNAVPLERFEKRYAIPIDGATEEAWIWRSPGDTWFIESDRFFGGPSLYGSEDDAVRFGFFCRAIAEILRDPPDGAAFDVFHGNDWQTGLVPAWLELLGLRRIVSVFTIHNQAYQGVFPKEEYPRTGLPWELFHMKALEYWGKFSFLKSGLVFSDALTTVSERYSREILTAEFGAGLEGVLQERVSDLRGILNGVDYEEWSPDRDRYLPARYSVENPSPKEICRSVLLREVGLPRGDDVPLAGCVGRLVEQKGFDLIEARIGPILDRVRLVLLGSGDARFEQRFRSLSRIRPDRIAVSIGYDESLAHRIEGGADLFLMPSRYEPCGLNQIYSLRYGAVPVVRATGGLDDTVVDADVDPANGNGFKFEPYDADALVATLDRALTARRDRRRWAAIRRNGMTADFSWDRAARKYADLYEDLRARGRG